MSELSDAMKIVHQLGALTSELECLRGRLKEAIADRDHWRDTVIRITSRPAPFVAPFVTNIGACLMCGGHHGDGMLCPKLSPVSFSAPTRPNHE